MGCGWANVLSMNIISHPLKYLQTREHFLLFPPRRVFGVSAFSSRTGQCVTVRGAHEGPPQRCPSAQKNNNQSGAVRAVTQTATALPGERRNGGAE